MPQLYQHHLHLGLLIDLSLTYGIPPCENICSPFYQHWCYQSWGWRLYHSARVWWRLPILCWCIKLSLQTRNFGVLPQFPNYSFLKWGQAEFLSCYRISDWETYRTRVWWFCPSTESMQLWVYDSKIKCFVTSFSDEIKITSTKLDVRFSIAR